MKRTLMIITTLAAVTALSGCSLFTTKPPKVPENGSYQKETRKDGTVTETTRSPYAIAAEDKRDERAAQKPIFELEALEGQTIELKGVKRMAIYSPSQSANGGQLPPPTRPLSGWEIALNVADRALDRGLQYFGIATSRQVQIAQIGATRDIALSRDASTVDMVDRIGQSNARIAGFIVPTGPDVTTTYNIGRDGNVGSGTQQNQNNPLSINCSSGSGAAGGNATGGSATPPATGGVATGGPAAGSGGVPCTVTRP